MAPTIDYLNIKDITPRTRKYWTAKIKVLETSQPRSSKTKAKRFQKLLFVDEEGMKVQASIFGNDINSFGNKLKLFHAYEISDALVSPIDPLYKIVPHPYQWIINQLSSVSEITSEVNIPMPPLSLTNFNDLHNHMNTDVDILAIVIDALPPKSIIMHNKETSEKEAVAAQEFIVINQELKPTMLTMWSNFIENEGVYIVDHLSDWTIIWAKRIKVGKYNGLSLSTKLTSAVLINPDIPETAALRSWALQNKQILEEMIDMKSYISSTTGSTSTNPSHPSPIIKIADIPEYPDTGETFKIRATACIVDYDQKFWYMCCSRCQKAINGTHNTQAHCPSCDKQVTAMAKCCITAQFQDCSGSITAVTFGLKAENLFSVTATNLLEHTNEDGLVDSKCLLNSATKEYMFVVKASRHEYHGETNIKFSVVCVHDIDT